MEAFRNVDIRCESGLDKLNKVIRNQDLSIFIAPTDMSVFFPAFSSCFAGCNLAKLLHKQIHVRLKEFVLVGSFAPKKTFFHESSCRPRRGSHSASRSVEAEK